METCSARRRKSSSSTTTWAIICRRGQIESPLGERNLERRRQSPRGYGASEGGTVAAHSDSWGPGVLSLNCHAGYDVDNVVDRFESLRIREKQASQVQCAGFAISAQTSIYNALKVDDMREADDAADHLAGAEAEHVGKQAIHEFLTRHLQRAVVPRTGKHGNREDVAV